MYYMTPIPPATQETLATALLGRTICVVGLSKDPTKESNSVAQYLQKSGYKIIPVNPTTDEILGEKCYRNLEAIPLDLAKTIDVVDIFRPGPETPPIVAQVAELSKRTGKKITVWLQLGITSADARKIAGENGLGFVENRCLRIEHQRRKANEQKN